MARVVLTDRFVSGAKAGDYFDAKSAGLNLRVTAEGREVLVRCVHLAQRRQARSRYARTLSPNVTRSGT